MAPKRSPTQGPRGVKRKSVHHSEGVLWKTEGKASTATFDPGLAEVEPKELLRRFLQPVTLDEFMRSCWAQRAVAMKGAPSRVRCIIQKFLHNLDLDALLSETPSERVHVWVKPKEEAAAPALESVAVDAEAARTLASAGAALYFRAPEELEGLLVPGLAAALGTAFAGRYPGDGRPRGEIETFVASRGHVTGWHTDFQHNFTVQLQGAKTWRFKPGPVHHNIRALTPHYRTRAAYESQMKVHLLSSPESTEFRPPDTFFEDAEEVTLEAGDTLYHPAGIWHRVDTVSDDSVSINVSLTTASWAELIGDGLRQVLWGSPALRAPVIGLGSATGASQTRLVAEALLAEVRRRTMALTVEDLLPAAAVETTEPPPTHVDLAKTRLGAGLPVQRNDRFRFSQLAIIVPLEEADVSSSESDAAPREADRRRRPTTRYYSLHVNFGNEDVASWLRVRLKVPRVLDEAMTWLRDRHLSERQVAQNPRGTRSLQKGAFVARELLAASESARKRKADTTQWGRVIRLLRVLSHCGYLHKVP